MIILSPTRELAMQTFGVLMELMKYHHHTYGLVMGGANRSTEAQKLSKGNLCHNYNTFHILFASSLLKRLCKLQDSLFSAV